MRAFCLIFLERRYDRQKSVRFGTGWDGFVQSVWAERGERGYCLFIVTDSFQIKFTHRQTQQQAGLGIRILRRRGIHQA